MVIKIPHNSLVNATLLLVIVACFNLVGYVAEKFTLPYTYGNQFTLLAPFCVMILVFNWYLCADRGIPQIQFDASDLVFAVALIIWCVLEYWHGFTRGFNLHLIQSYFWMFFFYFSIKSFHSLKDNLRDTVVLISIYAILFLVVLQILSYIGVVPGILTQWKWFEERPNVLHLNISSHVAIMSILLVIFFHPQNLSVIHRISLFFTVGLSLLLLWLNQTRGAALVVLGLVILWLLDKMPMRRILIVFPLGITLMVLAHLVGLFPYGELLSVMSFGRGLSFDDGSIAIRMGATLASFQQFLDAPLTGVGYNSAVTIRYAELLTHTHFVFILASYGVLGILPYVIFVGILFYSTPRESIVKSIAALSMILGVMVSELYLQWWFAIPLFLMWSQAGCSWDSAYDLMKAHRIGGSLISRSVASVRGAKFEGK